MLLCCCPIDDGISVAPGHGWAGVSADRQAGSESGIGLLCKPLISPVNVGRESKHELSLLFGREIFYNSMIIKR